MLKSRFNIAANEPVEEEEQTGSVSPAKPKPQRKGVTQNNEEEQMEEQVEEQASVYVTEERPVYDERRLNRSEVSVRLSMLGKTAEGDGYTYLKATITSLSLTEISAIKSFQYLQFLDVSNNNLTLNALQVVTYLPSLVLIHADQNLLRSAALRRMKYLQVIIVNANSLTSVQDVYQPELSTLEAGNNTITRLNFLNRMPTMRCLDFRNNLIKEITELDFPNLDSLYLAGNKIKSLEGLARLVNLRILHVRHNPIRLLLGFDERLKKLQYVNLRNCKVSTLIQVKKLRVLPGLETLIMKGCPFMGGTGEETADAAAEEDDAEIRVEILAALPRLKRINKGVITPEERTEAKELMMTWLEEGEKDEEEVVEEMQGEGEMVNEEE